MNRKISRTNTILYCHNWLETVSFYKDILELPINHQTDWFVEFQLTDTAYLSIANAVRASIQSVDGEGITLSWQVPDIHEAQASLRTRGVETTEIKKKWGPGCSISTILRAIALNSGSLTPNSSDQIVFLAREQNLAAKPFLTFISEVNIASQTALRELVD